MTSKPKFRIVPDEREPDRFHVFVQNRRGAWTRLYRESLSRKIGDEEIRNRRGAGFEVSDERGSV